MAKTALLQYKKTRRVEPFCVTWPGEAVQTDTGGTLEQPVLCDLRGVPAEQRHEVVKKMTMRTKAFAMVLIEERDSAIKVVFESKLGARAWVTPLNHHGDVRVPGRTHVSDNAECVGLLWRPAANA